MSVTAVSGPRAYYPVGIICRRPSIAPVKPVRPESATTQQVAESGDEAAAGKLLLDLSLIAPRPTATGATGSIQHNTGPESSRASALAATAVTRDGGGSSGVGLDLIA